MLYVSILSLLLFLYSVELSFREQTSMVAQRTPGSEMFSVLIIAAFLLLLALAAPILASHSTRKEDETLSPLGYAQIIIGKLSARSIITMVMPLSILPLLSLSAYTGGLPWSKIGLCYLLIFIASVAFNSIGMLWAIICTREESTITASYATICALTFMPFIISVFGRAFDLNMQTPAQIAQVFSPLYVMFATLGYVTEVTVMNLSTWWITLILYALIPVVLTISVIQIKYEH